VKNEPHGLSP